MRAFGAGAVAGQPVARALAGAGGGAALAGDEQPLELKRLKCLLRAPDGEAGVDGDLERREAEALQLGDGGGQQLPSPGSPGAVAGGSTNPRAPARVCGVISAM